jgi:hypothetical protein
MGLSLMIMAFFSGQELGLQVSILSQSRSDGTPGARTGRRFVSEEIQKEI